MQSLTQTGHIFSKPNHHRRRGGKSQFVVFDSSRAFAFVESFPHLNSLVLHTRLCDKGKARDLVVFSFNESLSKGHVIKENT